MPYRIDIGCSPPDAVDILVELGALDIECVDDGVAAILPDGVTQDKVTGALNASSVTVSAAVARDNSSVWLLNPAQPKALRLIESNAFGTGHHPTTALCVEALEEILIAEHFDSVLDIGTGSGILALTALRMGVPQALGLDTDADALKAAAANARLNHFENRLELVHGGPDVIAGNWPLVVANVLAAPLIEMAPVLVRRVGKQGRLILSGISSSLEIEVRRAYQHVGIRHFESRTRAGWTMLMAQASW